MKNYADRRSVSKRWREVMQPTKIFSFAPVSVLILLCVMSLGCGNSANKNLNFKMANIGRDNIEHRVIATGRIEPFSKVEIRSKVNGIIKTITVEEGDTVKRGQTIIELDKDILTSVVNEARAALENARAQYERAKIEASEIEIKAIQRKYARMQRLLAQGLATEEQMEDAETAMAIAKQNSKAREAAVSMAKANLSAVTAALDRAENELDYATIGSPVDGIVLSCDVDEGSTVASVASTMGTLLMTLGDMREMHMVGDVDESDIGLVEEGMPARITVESYPDSKFHGKVRKIAPLGVEKDKIMNFEVEVTIEETDVPLRTNMTADAEIIINTRKNVLLVPQNAVRYDRNQAFVEMPDPGEETGRRPVDITLGISSADFSEVLSGLSEGDKVIVSRK